MNHNTKKFKQKTSQNGLLVCLVTMLLLLVLIAVNYLATRLPTSITEIDISANKMYSVSDTTKRSLSKLSYDVDLYYLSEGGEDALADQALHTKLFLSKLPDYSSHLSFKVIDTTANPTFVSSLGITDEVSNNSVIIKSDKRTRILSQQDLFFYYIDGVGKLTETEAMQYVYMFQMYGQTVTPTYHFNGEEKMLTAIDYVSSDTIPKAYVLDGHTETALSNTLVNALSAQNIELVALTLMQSGRIPEDCDFLIINCPRSDLTSVETELISAFLENGGSLILITPPGVSAHQNLLSLAQKYGFSAEDGIIIEGNSNHFYQVPYYLFPLVSEHPITAEYANSTYSMLPYAHGIQIASELPSGVNATAIFTTSTSSYIVATDAETTARPEGQTTAPHHVGVVAEATNGSQFIWFSSSGITDEEANYYTANGNFLYFVSAAKSLSKTENSVSTIVPMTLTTPHLVVPAASAGIWSIVLIFLIPSAILIIGFVYWIKRRKK